MSNETEAKLRAVLETAVEGVITINERGIVTSFNPAAQRLFGYDAKEAIGNNVKLLMPSPYREQHDGFLTAYRSSGEKKIIGIGREVIGQRKDGSTFPMYLSVGEFRIHDARYFTGIVRDISKEKRYQQAMERSEAKMQAIFDTIVEGILTIDSRGIVKAINPAAIRMFGYESAEILGQNVKTIAPPPFREEHDTYLKDYVATGEKKIIGSGREVIGRRKDGSTFPMYLSVGEVWLDGEQYFTGIVRDLSEIKRAQQRESEIGRILDDSLNEIYIFDAESLRFVQVNKGARENLGYTLDELREMTPLNLKPDFTRQSFTELVEPLRTGERDQLVFETRHRRQDNTLYSVEVHLQLTFYDSRPAFAAVILDTTDRKQTEAKLLQAERLAAIGEVVSGVAHESRNALQRIQANVELAQMDADGNTDLLHSLEKIERAADGLTALLDQVRNYAAPIALDTIACGIAGVWRNAWSNIALLRAGRDARLEEDTGETNTRCQIDPFRFEQVFRNLFENSLAAGDDPVVVRVACGRDDARRILRIHVRDNGPGLDSEQRARVFDAFYTTRPDGTGLGMAIAKRTVEAHGGQIVARESARGAEFVIELPSP